MQTTKRYSSSKQDFWVKCPECKHSFAVRPAVVIKYLDRLIEQFSIRRQEAQVQQEQATANVA